MFLLLQETLFNGKRKLLLETHAARRPSVVRPVTETTLYTNSDIRRYRKFELLIIGI